MNHSYKFNFTNSFDADGKLFLNIGCGDRYKKSWVNIDFVSHGEDILEHDLTKPLPFADGTFDFVYSSHVLEHFEKANALRLLVDMHRVLKIGGICRVVVPDLESSANEYLRILSKENLSSSTDLMMKHEWSVIELTDQFTRVDFGGEMIKYLNMPNIDREYIEGRIGSLNFISSATGQRQSFFRRLRSKSTKTVMKKIRNFIFSSLIKFFGGDALSRNFKETIFRSYGEVHRSAWDRISLMRLFLQAGFRSAEQRGVYESESDSFLMDGLDFDIETRSIYKPNSLYFEGIKA